MQYSNRNLKNWKNKKGFTLVELLIAVLISGIVIIEIYNFFNYQQRNYALQDQLVEVQQNLRVGMDALSRDLRPIGYGVPSATSPSAIEKITAATEKSITFLANLSDVHTELTNDYDPAALSPNDSILYVNSSNGFANGNIIYVTDGAKWDQATITSVSGPLGTLTISAPLANPYSVGSTVHVVSTVTYTIDTTDKELTRKIDSGSAQPVCNNLDYLQFKYYDTNNNIIANPSPYKNVSLDDIQRISVRKISMLLIGKTSRQEQGHSESGTYEDGTSYLDGYHRTRAESDVMLRNLAF